MSNQALQRFEQGGITQSDNDWQTICQQAGVLVKTGFLPQSIKTPEQAMAIILTGRELGIGTMAALNSINVIQGKPTVSPQLMLALMNRTGQVEDVRIETSTDGASVTIKRRGRSAYTAKFGPSEARAMGLDGKDNYKKQPATMYKWRAIADAARVTFPDVILGLYTPDEMGAVVNEDGEVIEMESPKPAPLRIAPVVESVPTLHTSRDTFKEICNKLKAKGVSTEDLRMRVAALCDGETDFKKLSDADIDGLVIDFGKWLDELSTESGSDAVAF